MERAIRYKDIKKLSRINNFREIFFHKFVSGQINWCDSHRKHLGKCDNIWNRLITVDRKSGKWKWEINLWNFLFHLNYNKHFHFQQKISTFTPCLAQWNPQFQTRDWIHIEWNSANWEMISRFTFQNRVLGSHTHSYIANQDQM